MSEIKYNIKCMSVTPQGRITSYLENTQKCKDCFEDIQILGSINGVEMLSLT